MVQQLVGGVWKCTICNMQYEGPTAKLDAKNCETEHNVIYVKFYKEDLHRLLQFMITKDDSILSESLVATIMKYNTGKY